MKVLRTTRIDLSTFDPAGPVVVIPLECWRYTLTMYQPTTGVVLINGVDLVQNNLKNAEALVLSAQYTERVGGYPHQENSVRDTLELVFSGRPLYGIIALENWSDE